MPWPGTTYTAALTVCAIDLAAGDGLAAFSEHYPAPDQPPTPATSRAYTPSGVRGQLAGDLTTALRNGTVALGLEGPCWAEADGPLGPMRPRWFEQGTPSSWYGRSGGPAALKAALILAGLLEQLAGAVSEVTHGASPHLGGPGVLLIWEAFVVGEAKQTADFPHGEDWEVAAGTTRHVAAATDAIHGPARDDLRDAFLAVRHGYANTPRANPDTAVTGPYVMPIIGSVIAPPGSPTTTRRTPAARSSDPETRADTSCGPDSELDHRFDHRTQPTRADRSRPSRARCHKAAGQAYHDRQ